MAEAAAIASGHSGSLHGGLELQGILFDLLEGPRLVELLENPLEVLCPGEAVDAAWRSP
jgi:hypothetical protein